MENVPTWHEQIEKDLQGHELLGHETPTALARDYIEKVTTLQEKEKALEGAVTIPGDDADEDSIKAFYQKLGVPETPDGYEFEDPDLPDGVNLEKDEELEKEFKALCHSQGVRPKAAKAIVEYLNKRNLQAYLDQQKANQDRVKENEEHFKQTWGPEKYKETRNRIGRLINKFGTPETIEEINDSIVGNHRGLTELLANVALQFSEDSLSGEPAGEPDEMDLDEIFPSMKDL